MESNDTLARPLLPHGYPPAGVYARLGDNPVQQAMARFDAEFLRANADALRDYDAHWGVRPLRHWSRRWEYPYVFDHLRDWARRRSEGAPTSAPPLRLLDAGAGLTFFPHFLTHELAVERIDCTDRDPAMERDARRLRAPASPAVRFSTQDLAALDFTDATFDGVYCVSVLEHTIEWERIIDEFHRVLRPGGSLVITIDVSWDGRAEIPREGAARLLEAIERRFTPLEPYAARVQQVSDGFITTNNVGQYDPSLVPPRTYASAGGVLRRLLSPRTFPWRRAFRRALGRGPGGSGTSELSVFCATFLRSDPGTPPVGP